MSQRLQGWKVTHDGAFWGGIFLLITWGTALCVVAAYVLLGL